MTIKHGRQWGRKLSDIRGDHVARYQEAARLISTLKNKPRPRVLDAGCGCGYGSHLLASSIMDSGPLIDGHFIRPNVSAIDIAPEAIEFARENWAHSSIEYEVFDVNLVFTGGYDFVVAFEILEHIDTPRRLVEPHTGWGRADYVIGSVPNEAVLPFEQAIHREHKRHYTESQLIDFIEACGREVKLMGSQQGKHGKDAVINWGDTTGRTLVFLAE